MIETQAFRTFIGVHFLFKTERLTSNIKLTLYKTLIRSTMTYSYPDWEFAADNHLLIIERLQNKVLRTIRNFPRRTLVQDLHLPFILPQANDCITKFCRQQSEVIRNHENANLQNIGQGEARRRRYKRLKLGCGQVYYRSNN
jgi:hypothetical protein